MKITGFSEFIKIKALLENDYEKRDDNKLESDIISYVSYLNTFTKKFKAPELADFSQNSIEIALQEFKGFIFDYSKIFGYKKEDLDLLRDILLICTRKNIKIFAYHSEMIELFDTEYAKGYEYLQYVNCFIVEKGLLAEIKSDNKFAKKAEDLNSPSTIAEIIKKKFGFEQVILTTKNNSKVTVFGAYEVKTVESKSFTILNETSKYEKTAATGAAIWGEMRKMGRFDSVSNTAAALACALGLGGMHLATSSELKLMTSVG